MDRSDYWNLATAGESGLFNSIFGGGSDPYKDAMKQYSKYANQAAGYQNPFYNAGTAAIPEYQDYLAQMKDPSAYINNLMSGYQASPYSQYLQQESQRAGTNAASASGLTGSTPFAMQMQKNSADIASADMDKWLQNVLGIHSQYGQGLGNEISGGQNAANALSNIYTGFGNNAGQAAYGSSMAKKQQLSDIIGMLMKLGMLAAG